MSDEEQYEDDFEDDGEEEPTETCVRTRPPATTQAIAPEPAPTVQLPRGVGLTPPSKSLL